MGHYDEAYASSMQDNLDNKLEQDLLNIKYFIKYNKQNHNMIDNLNWMITNYDSIVGLRNLITTKGK